MSERKIGIVVSSDEVIAVDALVPDTGPLEVQADQRWRIQSGDRANAYEIMFRQIQDYTRERSIQSAVVKASAVSLAGTKSVHLMAAELRGVVIAALYSGGAKVQTLAKNRISRNFGERKADEYLADDTFWEDEVCGEPLRKGSREAALLLIASREV